MIEVHKSHKQIAEMFLGDLKSMKLSWMQSMQPGRIVFEDYNIIDDLTVTASYEFNKALNSIVVIRQSVDRLNSRAQVCMIITSRPVNWIPLIEDMEIDDYFSDLSEAAND